MPGRDPNDSDDSRDLAEGARRALAELPGLGPLIGVDPAAPVGRVVPISTPSIAHRVIPKLARFLGDLSRVKDLADGLRGLLRGGFGKDGLPDPQREALDDFLELLDEAQRPYRPRWQGD